MKIPFTGNFRRALFQSLEFMERRRFAVAILSLLTVAACSRSNFAEARQLVERYNKIVAEAYRRGDVKLIDPVVGPNDGKRITGLIGVRLDLGLTMDSQMLALEITGVEKTKSEMRVQTKEQWKYRDLKIGTGEQVGNVSTDSYEMAYFFIRTNQQWLVDEIKFTSTPQVGRKQGSWIADRAQLTNQPAKTEAQP